MRSSASASPEIDSQLTSSSSRVARCAAACCELRRRPGRVAQLASVRLGEPRAQLLGDVRGEHEAVRVLGADQIAPPKVGLGGRVGADHESRMAQEVRVDADRERDRQRELDGRGVARLERVDAFGRAQRAPPAADDAAAAIASRIEVARSQRTVATEERSAGGQRASG